MNKMTIFRGTLARHGQNDWRWVDDDTPEPRVSDLSPSSYFNFRCQTTGGGTYVEVLLSVAHRERDVLGWVLDGVSAGKYRQAWSGDHTGPMMIAEDGSVGRMHIEPGEDPLHGNEPIIRKRAIPRVVLVPVAEWDQWAKDNPYGAQWNDDDYTHLVLTACEHGMKSTVVHTEQESRQFDFKVDFSLEMDRLFGTPMSVLEVGGGHQLEIEDGVAIVSRTAKIEDEIGDVLFEIPESGIPVAIAKLKQLESVGSIAEVIAALKSAGVRVKT